METFPASVTCGRWSEVLLFFNACDDLWHGLLDLRTDWKTKHHVEMLNT